MCHLVQLIQFVLKLKHINFTNFSILTKMIFKVLDVYMFLNLIRDFLGPHQTIASIGDISMMTVPSLPCDQISYTCTAQVEAILGNKWKHGKTFAGIYGVNFYPSWTPNTWNSICIVLTSTKTKVYINNEIADEVSLNTFYELSLNTYVDIRKVK